MSKAHDPHWRYVAVRVAGAEVSRQAFKAALVGRARKEGQERMPRLTRYAWPHAIIQVDHRDLAAARDWLPQITWAIERDEKVSIQVMSLQSSGTIKTLTDRLGVLKQRHAWKGTAKRDKAAPARSGPGRHRQPPPTKH